VQHHSWRDTELHISQCSEAGQTQHELEWNMLARKSYLMHIDAYGAALQHSNAAHLQEEHRAGRGLKMQQA
jgi:hypothetical protein